MPPLLRSALELIGLKAYGPAEKIAWWVDFTFRGEQCQIAHQKFGVRIYLTTDSPEESAQDLLTQISKKLRSAVKTVEKVILEAAPGLLGRGDATVINQHLSLERAYQYFRERALAPIMIPDEHSEHRSPEGELISSSFASGRRRMQINAFHDMVAAITAYLSLLEHDLVLALAFTGFNPDIDDLTDVIGSRWGDKYDRVVGKGEEAAQYRARLTAAVERWRNPYSHGGFEKGHGATIYLHTPGVGAVPVGLTGTRNSPLFSLFPASEDDVADVFTLFDELDAWLNSKMTEAFMWIRSGLAVRFDKEFRSEVEEAQREGWFPDYVDRAADRQELLDNMDF
ncbi:hypothetical protein R4282_32385 [Rhodococcus oxybenzonivorans]|uniref:hypothetical protein n=1 Tax=Rhodococcus oxybenzonivorans TaxID=1990687 RepID=UPI00295470E3|nr:hypothetical protein [Rhodococcus oxybenzonivorans]MDV7357693.1 hypothetical protein [Rhodococcus oxybenzonivorans]